MQHQYASYQVLLTINDKSAQKVLGKSTVHLDESGSQCAAAVLQTDLTGVTAHWYIARGYCQHILPYPITCEPGHSHMPCLHCQRTSVVCYLEQLACPAGWTEKGVGTVCRRGR